MSQKVNKLLAPLLLAICLPCHAAQPLDTYLTISTGSLPIVLSVPHGGEVALDGAAERVNGTKVQDDRVNQLAAAIQRQLQAKTGKEAYLVGAKISRKYVDFNRRADEAYESPDAARVYEAYYGALRRAINRVRTQPGALLVDIHGQSFKRDVVFRGTGSGMTARNARFYGEPDGLITRLNGAGLNVQPETAEAKEQHFSGGTIVRVFGYQAPQGIDSVQLEFGASLRTTPARIEQTAAIVADALIRHLLAAHGQ